MADATKELQIVISAKDQATAVLQGFQGKLNSLGSDLKKAAPLLAGIGAGTVILAKGFVDAASKMEATRTAFNVLIGDATLADKTLKQLFELESKTPFTLESVLAESKKLLAMGTSAKDLTKTLSMLGDVAAGVGFEKLPQLTLAFGQIQAKGRLMGTELRQLTEAGFNLAEAMGISNQKLDDMIQDKAVGFDEVRAAFEKVTSEGGRFNGMMDSLSQTTSGKLSTLESSIFKLQASIGTILLPAVNQIITALLPFLDKLAAWALENQSLVAGLIIVGLALGAIGAAVLILVPIIAGLAAIFSFLGTVISVVAVIVGGIIAILGGPLTLIILAIVALLGLLALAWKNNWGGIREKTEAVVNWFKGTAVPAIERGFNAIKSIAENVSRFFIDKFNQIKGAIEGVIGAIGSLISKAAELAGKVSGGLKIPGFQHGGFVPGAYNQAVPTILHGGERVITRNGLDVNPGQGSSGGASGLTINFTGPVSLDSEDRIKELGEKIIGMLNRQNELASKGYGI